MSNTQKQELIYQLQKINAVQYGHFTLKSGVKSNYYFDLRKIYSFPDILFEITRHIIEITENKKFDLVCGVPLAGIPFATAYSLQTGTPMIVLRPQRKNHGNQQLIEGNYKHGDRVLLIEDVITTGGSILDTTAQLLAAGLVIKTVAVIVDRRGPEDKAKMDGMDIRCVLQMADFFNGLCGGVPQKMFQRQFHNTFSRDLWDLILMKQTNLCFSMDVYDLPFLKEIGDQICLLKMHLDINDTVNYQPLFELAEEKKFFILDDRKYADIGHIVNLQFAKNWLYCIRSCTVHSIFGQSTLDGLRPHLGNKLDSCFLIAQSSATDSFITPEYTSRTYQLGLKNADMVGGFITQKRLTSNSSGGDDDDDNGDDNGGDSFLYLTPGVQNGGNESDQMGQGYRSVEDAIIKDRCDIIIVGRGIYQSNNKITCAKGYRELGWKYLVQRYMQTDASEIMVGVNADWRP